jgi:hypothetical protein
VIPVMARGFAFPKIPLPKELAELPNFHGIEASHVYFEASMDKLALLLVASRKARVLKMAALGAVIAATACAIGFIAWRTNKQAPAPPGPGTRPIELAETLNSVSLDVGGLRKAERELDELRKSSLSNSDIQPVEALFTARAIECVSNEAHSARALIANWEALPEYAGWTQNLSSAESKRITNWWNAWSNCHFVVMNAQTVLADQVSEPQSEAEAQISGPFATEAASWSPDSWSKANEYHTKWIRARKANRYWEAWTNFTAFETNTHRAFAEAGELRGQYVSAKSSYHKITLCLTKKEIQPLLAEHARGDLVSLEDFAALAEQQRNPEGLANYSNAIALWPKVVGRAVAELLESGARALAEKQCDSGLQAVTNVMILAESTGLSERSKWVEQAGKLRSQLLAIPSLAITTNVEPPKLAKPAVVASDEASVAPPKDTNGPPRPVLPPPSVCVYLDSASEDPSRYQGVFKEFQDRFESAGNDRIHDRMLKKTWILIPDLLNWDGARKKAITLGARLPTLLELKTLIAQESEGNAKIFINTGYFLRSFRTPKCWTSEGSGFSQKYYVDFQKQTWATTSRSEMNHVFLIRDK